MSTTLRRRRMMMAAQGGSPSSRYAVTRENNAPIMDALWEGFGTGGNRVPNILSNPDYITMEEAAWFEGADFNRTGGNTSSVFYSRRDSITHFEELKYFRNVTSLPDYCFRLCKLESIEFPQGLTSLGIGAFESTSVFSVWLPDSVTTIPRNCFYNCTSLLEFSGDGVKTLESRAFYQCTSLQFLDIINVESVGAEDCLGNIACTSLYFPHCYDMMFNYAGRQPNLKTITLGNINNYYIRARNWSGMRNDITFQLSRYADNVKVIDRIDGEFWSHFSKYGVEEGNPTYEIRNGCVVNKITDTIWRVPNRQIEALPDVANIGDYAFADCTNLKYVPFNSSIKNVGRYAFYGCSSLEKITIKSDLALSDYAFNRSGLKTVAFRNGFDGLRSLGTFMSCENLESVTIPSSVNFIMRDTFSACPNLKTINCYALNPEANYHGGNDVTPFGHGYKGSTTLTDYAGYNHKDEGINELHVPSVATGYTSQAWLNPLLNPSLSNFSLKKDLGTEPVEEYEIMDYLESNGNQYINLGIAANGNMTYSVEFNAFQKASLTDSASASVFGCRTNASSRTFQLSTYMDGSVGYYNKTNPLRFITQYGVRHKAVLSEGWFYFDGEQVSYVGKSTFTTPSNLYLFANYESGTAKERLIGRIYSFNLYENGEVVRALVPAKRNADGVCGMLDTESGVFYTNKGTGSFVAGNE